MESSMRTFHFLEGIFCLALVTDLLNSSRYRKIKEVGRYLTQVPNTGVFRPSKKQPPVRQQQHWVSMVITQVNEKTKYFTFAQYLTFQVKVKVCAFVLWFISNNMEDYKIIEHIGDGAHGHVLKGLNLKTNEMVALKRIHMKKKGNDIPISILREIKILLAIDTEYVSIFNFNDLP